MRYFFDPVAIQANRVGKHLRIPGIIQNAALTGVLVHSMMAMQTGMQVLVFLVEKYEFTAPLNMIRNHQLSALFLVPAISLLTLIQYYKNKTLNTSPIPIRVVLSNTVYIYI